jgi:penicillin-insensitive murein endopeptidase
VELLEREHRLFYRRIRGADSLRILAAQFGDDEAAIRRRNKIERKRVPRGWGVLIRALSERIKATARGSATQGRLLNGEQMPPGLSHVVRYPMHAFATSRVVDLLYSVFLDLRRCDPDMPPVVVGDLSRPRGGSFPPHKSHQNGLDADLSYIPALQMHVGRGFMADRTTLDVPRTWAFLKRLMDTGEVEFLFVDRSVQKLLYEYVKSTMTPQQLRVVFQYPTKVQRGIIRHVKGHIDHVHVRFKKPSRVTRFSAY